MPSIIIDGAALSAREGSTILEAARQAGVCIPTLCYLKERSAIASCRLCVVEVAGEPHPVPACSTVVREGMEVTTRSPLLAAYRKMALELILSSKGPALAACAQRADGELAALCHELGVEAPTDAEVADGAAEGTLELRFPFAQGKESPRVEGNPFLSFDPNRCIKCQRCVGACNAAARNHSLGTRRRGALTLIAAPFGPNWRASECESCGNCAQACPTGAISLKARGAGADLPVYGDASDGAPANLSASGTRRVRTTCPHCGVGCQLELEVRDGRIRAARGAQGASNRGLLCVKGRSASFDFVGAPDRLTTPLVRNRATGELEPATWDEALSLVASRLSQLRDEHGGESLAAFACSRSTNEDVYLFQKMARAAFKTNNVDSCARV